MGEQALRRLGALSVALNPIQATNTLAERQEPEAPGALSHSSMTRVVDCCPLSNVHV